MKNVPALVEKLLEALPLFLAFFVPIFFLPLTTEFFEFNKMALIAVSTALMLILWTASMFYKRSVEVVKSPVDVSMLLVLAVFILSTIFSIHKVSSIFGSQGRWFPSLFGVLTLLVFYYVLATTASRAKMIKEVINALMLGISVSSVVALLSYFGLSLGTAAYLQIPNFTLTGSTVTASVLAALAVVFALTKVLGGDSAPAKFLSVLILIPNFLAVALVGSVPSWVALFVGLLVVAYFVPSNVWVKNKAPLGLVGLFILTTIVLLAMPVSRGFIVNENYPQEIKITPQESWLVVSSVIRDFPVLGTGPSTFGLDYTRYRPLSVNEKEYWNVRFDKPYSEAFAVVGSLGIVGVTVVLAFGIKALRYSLRTKNLPGNPADTNSAALAAGFISLLIVMFFTYATITLAFLLVLFLALTTVSIRLGSPDGEVALVGLSLSSLTGGKRFSLVKDDKEVFQYFVAVPLLALVLAGGYYLYRQYAGEYYMRKAVLGAVDNDGGLTYGMQQRAINVNPSRDLYHNSYASTNLALANAVASRGQLSDEEKNTVQALVSQSIRSSRIATEVLNPLNAANWETRANIYRALVGVADNASEWAVRAYTAAIQLDPANPRLRLNLGGLYYANGDYLSAANLFNQAVSLKGDYANAHYNLGQALVKLENYPQARAELELVQKLVEPNSEDFQKVAAELEALSQLPNVAGVANTQPSIEELEGTTSATPPPQQEPLQNAGEQETLENGSENLQVEETPQEQPQEQPQQ